MATTLVVITKARVAPAIPATVATLLNPDAVRPETHLHERVSGGGSDVGLKSKSPQAAPGTGSKAFEVEVDEELPCDMRARINSMRVLQREVLLLLTAALVAARTHDEVSVREHVAEGRRLSQRLEISRETLLQVNNSKHLTSNCSIGQFIAINN